MSYLERLATLRRWQPDSYRPFLIDGMQAGRVGHAFARALGDFPRVFQVDRRAVLLRDGLGDLDARSAAVHDVVERLAARGDIRSPRGETYGVSESWGAPVLLRIDRGAVPLFGIKAYGVHVNGFRYDDGRLKLWIATRARDKRVAPGKLDNMVAGGLSHGYSVRQTLVKEAEEEASVPAAMAARAEAVGALSYLSEAESGLRDDTLFVFDLEVPPNFTPDNTDGELERFDLWDVDEAMARVRDSEDFKFNVAAVMIDFLLRHGRLDPDRDPDYLEIVAALHGG